jgi:hypothetical protein
MGEKRPHQVSDEKTGEGWAITLVAGSKRGAVRTLAH